MKKFRLFLMDGVLFLLPVMLLIFLFKAIIGLLLNILSPFIALLPEESIFGFGMENLASLFILLLLVIVGGLISRSKMGVWFKDSLVEMFMSAVPGFSVIKKLFYGSKEDYEDESIKSALALIDDAWLFAFILEEKNHMGLLTVFVPSAPIPTSGNVYLMTEEQVRRIDLPVKETVKCIFRLGVGSGKILEGKIKL